MRFNGKPGILFQILKNGKQIRKLLKSLKCDESDKRECMLLKEQSFKSKTIFAIDLFWSEQSTVR